MSPVESQHPHEHLHLRPLHDRATLIVFASLASWSWFVYSFGASLGLLREEQGTSTMIGGLHGTALALGGVLGAIATPRLNQRFGRGHVMRISAAGAVVGILIFTIPGITVVGTLAAAFIACFFGNIIVVCVNSFIVRHQGSASAPALTESNALAALAGTISPNISANRGKYSPERPQGPYPSSPTGRSSRTCDASARSSA